MVLQNKHILMFIAEEYEDLELLYPKIRMAEAGAKVTIAGDKAQETYHGKKGYPSQADVTFDSISVNDFDALIIPGGYAPDKLRKISKVIEITRQFHDQKKLIAYICHAGWIPVSAKIVKGIRCTSYISIKDDMVNAGANWVDEPVVVDRNIISSRTPDDLPYFCPAIIAYMKNN